MHKNQQGFTHLAVIALAAIVVIGVVGFGVFQSQKARNDIKSDVQAAQPEAIKKRPASDTSNPYAAQDAVVTAYLVRVLAAADEYWANNNGAYPAVADAQAAVNDSQFDAMKSWQVSGPIVSGTPEASTLYYSTGYTCDDKQELMIAGQAEDLSVVALLPSGKAKCVGAS